jgi:ATP-dependent HslUV protease subunit HslV
MHHTELSAGDICREAMKIAAGLCIYSNNEISLEEL